MQDTHVYIINNAIGGGCYAYLVTNGQEGESIDAQILGDLATAIQERWAGLPWMMSNDTAWDFDGMGVAYTRFFAPPAAESEGQG